MRFRTANSAMERIKNPPPLPPRPVDGQKGLFGRVLIVGGSMEMIGAPVMAGEAALRMGSGLVQIALPGPVLAAALSVEPELIGMSLDESAASTNKLLEAAQKADVLAIGPGLGESKSISKRLDALFRLDKPMVVDADALNYLASLRAWPKSFAARAVLTPHPGEMKRLAKLIGRDSVPTDEKGRIGIAVEAARAFGQIILLKGHRTVVTDSRKIYINHTGDSSLSKAGAGDVLSGILASLIGQGMDLFDAACAAAHLHGRAGEMAGKKLGRRSVLARDVIDEIGKAANHR
jgi:ADP-dependent NAD(P)H-hydrate dehydratase